MSRVVCLSFGQSVAVAEPCPSPPTGSPVEQLNVKRNCSNRLGGIGNGAEHSSGFEAGGGLVCG